MDFLDPERAGRAELREQLLQTGSAVLDEGSHRQNLSVLQMKNEGFNAFIRRNGEPFDLVFPGGQRLDRSLPTDLLIGK